MLIQIDTTKLTAEEMKVFGNILGKSATVDLTSQLTPTEIKVLGYVAQGLENQEIADTMFNSERTIRTHISNMLSKLCLGNRTKLAIFALQNGFANLDDIKLQHVAPVA